MSHQWKNVSFALAAMLAGALVTGVVMSLPQGMRSDAYAQQQGVAIAAQQNLSTAQDLSTSFRNVADALKPSVVSISTTQKMMIRGRVRSQLPPSIRRQLPPGFEDLFGFGDDNSPRRQPQREGMGSGVIVRSDGYILTNNHVVEGADELTVELSDGRKVPGKIVGTDPETDLAVIKVELTRLQPAVFGSSDDIRVGDWVLAIGSPFGLDQTVTAGIISGKNRVQGIVDDGNGFEDFLQTDAAINPGNSGGPLVNLRGELVGINTAILSRSGASAGIGFAIPVSLARPVLDSIIESGVVKRGFLGASVADVTPEFVDEFDLKTTIKVPSFKASLKINRPRLRGCSLVMSSRNWMAAHVWEALSFVIMSPAARREPPSRWMSIEPARRCRYKSSCRSEPTKRCRSSCLAVMFWVRSSSRSRPQRRKSLATVDWIAV